MQHEALDDSVKDDPIIVAMPRVCDPVLHSLGALLREQLDVDVAPSAVKDGCSGQGPRPPFQGRGSPCCQHVFCAWLLIEYIPAVIDRTSLCLSSC